MSINILYLCRIQYKLCSSKLHSCLNVLETRCLNKGHVKHSCKVQDPSVHFQKEELQNPSFSVAVQEFEGS